MATRIEDLSTAELRAQLGAAGCACSPKLSRGLHAHYRELQRWAARVALVGAGEAGSIVERHYAESLRAVPLLEDAKSVLDLGSGAGFPGLLLAMARPEAGFWLFESRGKKAAFLRSASARAKLSCRIVGARVSKRDPVTTVVAKHSIDVVTVRGVRLTHDLWQGLAPGLAAGARMLRWEGADAGVPWPEARRGRTVRLGGRDRVIQEWHYLG